MSHTSVVDTVMIVDVDALQSAVAELQRRGMKIALKTNQRPRAFFNNQQGMGVADFVVELGDSPYDVGLYKQDKGYEARADFYDGHISRVLGAKAGKGENVAQAKLGKLYQMYAVCAAEKQAFRQGYSPQRVDMPDGTIQLQIAVA